ncbi:NepR family anti-sigma factor [Methylobacterium oryzisoli]|uniref:NepR family anti-sigma factor n=1 Tax=Methylobacterium oryzisoli TaxID=3385502 RepID=UPI00389125E9
MTNDDQARPDPSSAGGRDRTAQGRPLRNQTGMLDGAVREDLGRALRHAYADLLEAPIPDRFVALLTDLDRGLPAPEEGSR